MNRLCESSAKQTIHMKYQDFVFFEKFKKKYFKMSSAEIVIGAAEPGYTLPLQTV